MARSTSQWLRLQLKEDVRMKDVYLSIYTHFSIYSSCIENGHTLAFYQVTDHLKNAPGAVCYIKTDHDGFYDSCLKYYAHRFKITPMEPNFRLPTNYGMAHGHDHEMATAQAV